MKRLLAILLVLVSLLCILPVSAADTAEKPIEVYYLGNKLEFPVPPQLIANTTMVPMRTIFEELGYAIEWDSALKMVIAYKDETIVSLTIGDLAARVNTDTYQLDTAPVIINSSTLIPLRFIGEASGYDVIWNAADRSVTLKESESTRTALEEQKNGIIEDLKTIKNDLPKLHKNLFFYKTKESFNTDMDALIAAIPTLDEYQIKFQLMKIINSVNDPHTNVYFKSPGCGLRFFQFDNDVYLIDGPEIFSAFIGQKLTAINQVSLSDIIKKLTPIVAFENESIKKTKLIQMLEYPAFYLRAIGITKSLSEPVTYSFADKSFVASLNYDNLPYYSRLPEAEGKYPLPYQKEQSAYSHTFLKNDKVLYVKYNSCSNMFNYPFSTFTKEVFDELEKKHSDTLIIDLRDNGGGNSSIFEPFLREISNHSNINKTKHLYVIVGRKTFSSAILNAVQLKTRSKAIFVGEPTGGNPNHYGEIRMLQLGYLNVSLYYSTKYFNTVFQNVNTFTPDIVVTPKAESFFSGKDDFLEAVFADMDK